MRLKIFFLFIIFIPLSGCLSLIEKTGQVLDGSALNEKTTAVFRSDTHITVQSEIEITVIENKQKEKSLIIAFKKYPMINLRVSFPDINGLFQFTSLEYLAASAHGWNEYSLQILGTGRLYFDDIPLQQLATLEIIESIERVHITAARIQRYDTRITGDEALTSLRNRSERLTSLVEWMLSLDAPIFNNISDFEKYWKPVLFPETVFQSSRPFNWRQAGDVFSRAENINWNNGYTERVFPQELSEVRNSGTLLRDFEESLSWIYMEYEWDEIMKILSQQRIFIKARS